MKKTLALVLAAAMLTTLGACGRKTETPAASSGASAASSGSTAAPANAPEHVFRYAENQPQDYPTTQGAYKFAELVEEKTNGRIKIEVYHGAQLGDEKSVIEQLQFGAIDFTRVSLSPLAEFSDSLNVLQLPYLYRDDAHMWTVLDGGIGAEFLASIESAGLVGLSWYGAGSRNFYNSKREIKTLEDLKGLNIRVQESGLMMGMVEALGANPTPMAYGEVYSGLQTGTIDGAENNWPSYESTSHYEVAKYFVLDEHTRVPEMQMMSKMTMEKLSPEDMAIIRECALESAKFERKAWAEREEASEEKVRAAGAVITELSAEEKAKFQAACKPLYAKFAGDYTEIIDRILATK